MKHPNCGRTNTILECNSVLKRIPTRSWVKGNQCTTEKIWRFARVPIFFTYVISLHNTVNDAMADILFYDMEETNFFDIHSLLCGGQRFLWHTLYIVIRVLLSNLFTETFENCLKLTNFHNLSIKTCYDGCAPNVVQCATSRWMLKYRRSFNMTNDNNPLPPPKKKKKNNNNLTPCQRVQTSSHACEPQILKTVQGVIKLRLATSRLL